MTRLYVYRKTIAAVVQDGKRDRKKSPLFHRDHGLRSTVTSTTNSSVHVLPGKIHCFQSRFAGVLREKTAQDFGLV